MLKSKSHMFKRENFVRDYRASQVSTSSCDAGYIAHVTSLRHRCVWGAVISLNFNETPFLPPLPNYIRMDWTKVHSGRTRQRQNGDVGISK